MVYVRACVCVCVVRMCCLMGYEISGQCMAELSSRLLPSIHCILPLCSVALIFVTLNGKSHRYSLHHVQTIFFPWHSLVPRNREGSATRMLNMCKITYFLFFYSSKCTTIC